MSIYTCEICNKTFSSALAIAGHKRMHGGSNGKLPPIKCCCIITKKELPVRDLIRFQTNLKYCLHCNKPLSKSSQKKFCNHICSASYNNSKRSLSIKTKEKISKSLTTPKSCNKVEIVGPYTKIYFISCKKCGASLYSKSKKQICSSCSTPLETRLNKQLIVGPFSKLYYKKCTHCNSVFCSRHKRKYCSSCSPLYDKTYRQRFKFTFNVYKYPDLFDLDYITSIGWYSRGGTAGVWNPDGLSRDHKVSVTDAIKNNYDPFYISHPINCEIMPWVVNNKKKGKSSLLYEDLIILVDKYESSKLK